MGDITDDLKLAMARDITAAYVRNEAVNPSPEQAADMLKAMYNTINELVPDGGEKKVGLGL